MPVGLPCLSLSLHRSLVFYGLDTVRLAASLLRSFSITPGAAAPTTGSAHDTCLPYSQPEDASGGSSPSGTSKSDANRASSGGGGGGLMEEMNKLLAKRWVQCLLEASTEGHC